jgi:hypothetical protein
LILEGLEDVDTESVNILDGQPPMSILIDAQCIFLKSNQKLSGGSIFLQNLSHAVSKYAQAFLSGLSQPDVSTTEYPQITLTRSDQQQLHRLTYEPQPGTDDIKTEIDLSTVELFDLVDAIDRFYLDRSTLPNMTLELRSVSRRYRQPEQPLAERLTPLAIGFTSLAIAAGALFIIPPPKTAPPESTPLDRTTETESQERQNPTDESDPETDN